MAAIIVAFPKLEDAKKLRKLLIRNGYDASVVCDSGAQLRLPEQPDQEVYLYEVIVGDVHGDALRENGIMLYYNDGTVVEYESQD